MPIPPAAAGPASLEREQALERAGGVSRGEPGQGRGQGLGALLEPVEQRVAEVAERDLAAADLKRYRDLREKNFISQADFDRRASTLASATARLEAAQAAHRVRRQEP